MKYSVGKVINHEMYVRVYKDRVFSWEKDLVKYKDYICKDGYEGALKFVKRSTGSESEFLIPYEMLMNDIK